MTGPHTGSHTGPQTARKKRANGLESRQRILDAAVEIAGERGYECTSIATVSARCGLPASSIYWHFEDKDDLIAAVIERSFTAWPTAVELPDEDTGTPLERVTAMAANVAKSLVDAPDFLRLGLMLALVPYASHRMAVALASDIGRSPLDVRDGFRGFCFDTALSSSPAVLPTLLAFARPGRVLFGSDWPFAPTPRRASTSQAASTPASTRAPSPRSTAPTPRPCSPA